ncbi:MAG TPA: DUF559 domain-containing protein [Solirubrobacter sp.]|nr:DUF559 domain-containing protein [Solirubrobacter sp.]
MRNRTVATRKICSSPLGLFTTADLLAAGLTYGAIGRRVKHGGLVRRYPGVYSYPGDLSREAQWMAAVLAADGVLAGRSAGELFRVSRFRASRPQVLVPRRHRPIGGIDIRCCRRLDPRDVTVYRGVPVTTVARLLVDLGDDLTAHQIANVIHEAAYRKRFDLTATRAALARASGRRNLHVTERAVALHLAGSAGTRSYLEDAFLALVAPLPEPLVNTALYGYEVDFQWPARKLVVEVDGPAHLRPASRKRDEGQTAALIAAGHTVLRFTDVEIDRFPDDVLAGLLGRF